MIALAKILSRRLHIGEQRNVEAIDLPVLGMKFDAGMLGHGGEMGLGVSRAADGRIGADRVEEGFARQDVGGLQVLEHDLDRAAAGAIGHLPTLAVGRRNVAATGQRHAEGLGQSVHG